MASPYYTKLYNTKTAPATGVIIREKMMISRMALLLLYISLIACDSSTSSEGSAENFEADPFGELLLGQWVSSCYQSDDIRRSDWRQNTYEFYVDEYLVVRRNFSDELCSSEIVASSIDLDGNIFESGEWNEYEYLKNSINSQGFYVSYYSVVGICPVENYNNNCDPLSSAFMLGFSITIKDDLLYFSKANLTDEIDFDIPHSRVIGKHQLAVQAR